MRCVCLWLSSHDCGWLSQETELLESVYCPASKRHWTNLRNRRLQNHGGIPHAGGMLPEPLPPFLEAVCAAIRDSGVFPVKRPPNHVLLNEYGRTRQGERVLALTPDVVCVCVGLHVLVCMCWFGWGVALVGMRLDKALCPIKMGHCLRQSSLSCV